MSQKVVPYEEMNYQKKREIYDVVVQCMEDLKYGEVCAGGKWNTPVEKIKGLTSRLIGEGYLEVTYHHYEVTTVEGLARSEGDGKDFIKEVIRELKKRFKKYTKKSLDLKEVKYNQSLEKVSRIQSDTSWMLGSNRYGYGARPVGRYLVRDSCVYEFDAELLK